MLLILIEKIDKECDVLFHCTDFTFYLVFSQRYKINIKSKF